MGRLLRCATATTADSWLHVAQDGPRVRVNAQLGDIQRLEGRLVLTGPITERLEVPVVVRTTTPGEEAESKPAKATSKPTSDIAGSASAVIERADVNEERAAATERSLWDGPRLGPRGLLIMIVDLILLALGGIIAVSWGLDQSVGVIRVAAAALIITCLVMRRLPFVLSAILAVVAVALLCEAFALPRHVDFWNRNENINDLPTLVVCCVLVAALTLIMIASYRPSPEARTGHDLRSTGIVTGIVLALAPVVSVVFVHFVNADWCYQQSDSPCRTNALVFELPVLLGQVIPFGVVIVVLLYATWTGRRRLASGAAVASAFLCSVTAAVDLAMFYAYPYDLSADTNRAASYAVAVLLVAAVVAGITAVKPSWVKTLLAR